MRLYLMENGLDIKADQSEKYDFVVAIASGEISHELIVEWIQNHSE